MKQGCTVPIIDFRFTPEAGITYLLAKRVTFLIPLPLPDTYVKKHRYTLHITLSIPYITDYVPFRLAQIKYSSHKCNHVKKIMKVLQISHAIIRAGYKYNCIISGIVH